MNLDKGQLQDLIQAELDGELSVAERAELARFLLQEPEARRLQGEFRKTDQLLRDIAAAEPPPGLRAAILAAPAPWARQANSGSQRDRWPAYRVAAAIMGGLLIVGVSYLVRDATAPGTNLQGSLIAPKDHWSMRAEGVEVEASLQRNGQALRLELNVSTPIPCEVIVRTDAASSQATFSPAVGSQSAVLDISGAAPIQLQLRAGGRLLGEGRLELAP